jgi:hypothetical protein
MTSTNSRTAGENASFSDARAVPVMSERSYVIAVGALICAGVVARLWALGHAGLDFDEAFSYMAGRRGIPGLFSFLRHKDAHPPLDYLIRMPLAQRGVGAGAFRLPSVVLSTAALAVFAVWMRRLGRAGIIAVALMAVVAFQLTYARDARMYAGMVLVGVLTASSAHQWLVDGRRRHAWICGAATLVGLFLHASAIVMAVGLFAVPRLRRDADAWWWRAALVGAAAVWAAVWGPSFVDQVQASSASWIPHTSFNYLAVVVNELVDSYPTLRWYVVAGIGFGAVLLWRRDQTLGWVWCACFLIPLVAAALIGLRAHYLLPRTLAFASWAPLLALAMLIDEAMARWWPIGVVAAGIAALVVLPSAHEVLKDGQPSGAAVLLRVRDEAVPGDVVAIHPRFLAPLSDWYLGVRRPGPEHGIRIEQLPSNADALLLGGRPWDGRMWLVQPTSYSLSPPGFTPCARTYVKDSYRVECLERDPAP